MINKVDYFLNYNKNAQAYVPLSIENSSDKTSLKPLKELLYQQPLMQPIVKPIVQSKVDSETNTSTDQIPAQPLKEAINSSKLPNPLTSKFQPLFDINKFSPKLPLKPNLGSQPQPVSTNSESQNANENEEIQNITIDKDYTSSDALWPKESDNIIVRAIKYHEIYNKGFSDSQNSIEYLLKKYSKKYSGQSTVEAKNEARNLILNLNNGYWITDEKMNIIAQQVINIQNGKGYVKINLDETVENDGENAALKQVLSEGMIAEQQLTINKYEDKVKDYVLNGKTDEKKMAEIIYKAAVDHVPLQNQNKMALQLINKNLDIVDQDGTYANEALLKLINYKDNDVTFFDELNTYSASAREGFKDGLKGMGTHFLKYIGEGYNIPNSWQAPSFQKKQIDNNKESMGEFGKVLTDVSYGIGNLAPTVVLDLIDPDLALAQMVSSIYGQTYNQSKGQGYSEEDSQTYAVLNAGIFGILKKIGLFGKGEVTNTFIKKLAGDSIIKQTLLPYIKTAGGAAVAGSLIELMNPFIQNATLTGSDKKLNKEDILHSAVVYAIMGTAFKGMRDISKMGKVPPVEKDGNVNKILENTKRLTYDEFLKLSDEQLRNYVDSVNNEYADHLKKTTNFTDEQIQNYLDEAGKIISRESAANQMYDQQRQIDKFVPIESVSLYDEGMNALKTKTYLTDTDISSMIERKISFSDEQLNNMNDKQMFHVLRSLSFEAVDNAKSLGKNFNNFDEILSLRDTGNVEGMKSLVKELQGELKDNDVRTNLKKVIENDNINTATKQIRKSVYNYRKTFFDQFPAAKGKVVVHHAIEQRVLEEFNETAHFTEAEINSIENLRGIPNEFNSDIHLSKIRIEWNRFYRKYPQPTREQFYNKVKGIDVKFGGMFNPQIKNGGEK